MKLHPIIISLLLFVIPFCAANAGWEVASPEAAIPREPFFQAGKQQQMGPPTNFCGSAFPNQFANLGQPATMYAMSISGSLKENIERIMGRYHWRVVWTAPYDFNFDGRVTGSSLPNVIEKLLRPFPLQAVMYMSNRTLAVIPRDKLGRDVDA